MVKTNEWDPRRLKFSISHFIESRINTSNHLDPKATALVQTLTIAIATKVCIILQILKDTLQLMLRKTKFQTPSRRSQSQRYPLIIRSISVKDLLQRQNSIWIPLANWKKITWVIRRGIMGIKMIKVFRLVAGQLRRTLKITFRNKLKTFSKTKIKG